MDRNRKIGIAAAALLAVFCIFLIGYLHPATSKYPDSDSYIKMANGDIKDVPQPFASRVINPFIVHTLSSVSGLNIDVSFYIVNIFLLIGFVFVLSLFFSEISFMDPLLVFIVLFVPFLLDFHRNFYMSDVIFGFLAVLFLFFLKRKNIFLSLPLLFLLFFSRPTDATIIGVFFVAASFYKKEIKFAWGGLVTVLTGYLYSSLVIVPLGATNIHNLSSTIYRFLEPFYYFVRNILGIDWMVNTQVQYCQVQHFLYFPSWIRLGNIKWVGICGFDILNPLSLLIYPFITFGLIPWMLFSVLRRFNLRKNWRVFVSKTETWVLAALGYGIVLFFLGLLVPNLRTVSYGWPAFWLAGFFIFDKVSRKWPDEAKKSLVKSFIAVQVILLWLPYFIVQYFTNVSLGLRYFLALLIIVIMYSVFFRIYSGKSKKYNLAYDLQIDGDQTHKKENSEYVDIKCSVCGTDNPEFFARKNSCNLYKCRQCRFIFVHPIPGNLSEIYTKDYFAGAKKGSGYVDYEKEKKTMGATVETYLDEIEKLKPGRGKLFEIGAATGTFLEAASRRGWEVGGVEISGYAAEKAREKGLDVITGTLEDLGLSGAQFDVIAMWDVLEHLPNAAGTLKLASGLLKPGGLIALNTPNAGSLLAKFMGKHWHLIVPPEHLSYFGTENLTMLFGKTGMRVRRATCLGKKFTLQYVSRMLASWYKFFLWQWLAKKTQTGSLGKLALSINLRDNLFLIAEKENNTA